jgi:hypothetical protein
LKFVVFSGHGVHLLSVLALPLLSLRNISP